MKVSIVPVATGTVLERFDILEDDLIVGYMQRERRPPLNPRGVFVSYLSNGPSLGESDSHTGAVRRVLEHVRAS